MSSVIRLCEWCQRPFSVEGNKPWIRHCCTKCEIEDADVASIYIPPTCDGCGLPALPGRHYCSDACHEEVRLKRRNMQKEYVPQRKSWRQKPGVPIPPEVLKLHELALKTSPREAAAAATTTRSALIARLWRYGLSVSGNKKTS